VEAADDNDPPHVAFARARRLNPQQTSPIALPLVAAFVVMQWDFVLDLPELTLATACAAAFL
jgi:hypothetical protein